MFSFIVLYFKREQPIFSARAHVFQIDPATKRNWLPASKHAVTVSFFYDASRSVYRIISVGGTKVGGHRKCDCRHTNAISYVYFTYKHCVCQAVIWTLCCSQRQKAKKCKNKGPVCVKVSGNVSQVRNGPARSCWSEAADFLLMFHLVSFSGQLIKNNQFCWKFSKVRKNLKTNKQGNQFICKQQVFSDIYLFILKWFIYTTNAMNYCISVK